MRNTLAALAFSFMLWPFFFGQAGALTCQQSGGACRSNVVSGCVAPEDPYPSGTCSNALDACCRIDPAPTQCSNNFGTCRSEYYTTLLGCPYGEVPNNSLSCGGSMGQTCCVAPPNVGAACSTGSGSGTCQLPGNCAGSFIGSLDCVGGTQCCIVPPSLTTFSVTDSCTIAVGASICPVTVIWSIANPFQPAVKQDGTTFSTAAASPGMLRTVGWGLSPFSLYDGAALLGTVFVNATCASGSTWNGRICASTAPTAASFVVPATCTIPVGASTCTVLISWGVTNAVTPTVKQDGTVFSTDATSNGVPRTVGHDAASVFELADGGTVLGSKQAQGMCDNNTNWDGGICAPIVPPAPTCNSQGGNCVQITLGCEGAQTPGTGTCSSGQMCCLGAGPGPGNVCVGQPSGGAGICRTTCNPNLETAEQDSTNCGAVPCCTTLGTITPPPSLPGDGSVNFMNPLKWNDVNSFLCSLLNFLQGFIVTLALIFIIIGAFMYITSAGDTGRAETAKKAIFAALIGLALGIAAPAFLKAIADLLGWTAIAACTGVGTGLTLVEIAGRVLNFLLSIIGIASLIMLIVGAFMYLTAAGDEGRIDSGKSIVKYAIIGITVALSALVLVRLVASFF